MGVAALVPPGGGGATPGARHLVDDPEGVFVDATERRDTIALLIHASPGDLGRIIGKQRPIVSVPPWCTVAATSGASWARNHSRIQAKVCPPPSRCRP